MAAPLLLNSLHISEGQSWVLFEPSGENRVPFCIDPAWDRGAFYRIADERARWHQKISLYFEQPNTLAGHFFHFRARIGLLRNCASGNPHISSILWIKWPFCWKYFVILVTNSWTDCDGVPLRVCLRFEDDGISGIFVGERTKDVSIAVIVCFVRISHLDGSESMF